MAARVCSSDRHTLVGYTRCSDMHNLVAGAQPRLQLPRVFGCCTSALGATPVKIARWGGMHWGQQLVHAYRGTSVLAWDRLPTSTGVSAPTLGSRQTPLCLVASCDQLQLTSWCRKCSSRTKKATMAERKHLPYVFQMQGHHVLHGV